MRLSVVDGDPGYCPLAFDPRVHVFLDDVEQSDVITADEEQGMLLRYKLDDLGQPVLNLASERFVTEECRGKVRIEVSP